MRKLRITQTLLSAWGYVYKSDDGYDEFINTLNRIPKEPTKAMLDGTRFEGCVNAALDGNPIPKDHEWYEPVTTLARYLKGSQQQVTQFRDIEVDGVPFLLHGVLDFLKAGVIYDTKFSKTYHLNKYFDSPQHSMYFSLVPEARMFKYLICDGKYIYSETYYPGDVVPIERQIQDFMRFLDRQKLIDTFVEKWGSDG